MKKAIVILALMFISVSLWAAVEPFIRQYNTSFTVDLASKKFRSHKTYSTWNSATAPDDAANDGKYYQSQELCVIGLTGVRYADDTADNVNINGKDCGKWSANGSVTLEVRLLSGEWFYTLEGTEYKRPFGLDIFCRGRLISRDNKVNQDADIPGYNMHLGNQAYTAGETSGTFSKTIPANSVRCYDFIWWDICLVMDPTVDTSTDTVTFNSVEYPLLPSDIPYSVDIELTISCSDGTSETFPIHLQGIYKTANVDTSIESIHPNLTIIKTADSFRLDGDTGLIRAKDPTEVATYSLSSSSYSGDKKSSAGSTTNKMFIFMSTSPSGYNDAGKFALHHVNDPYGLYVPQIVFKVIMTSTDTRVGDGSANGYYRELPHRYVKTGNNISEREQAEIDAQSGTNRQVTFLGNSFVTSGVLPAVAMEVWSEVTRQKVSNRYSRWNDSGNISIKLTGTMLEARTGNEVPLDTTALPQGEYTEDIYVHVVSVF